MLPSAANPCTGVGSGVRGTEDATPGDRPTDAPSAVELDAVAEADSVEFGNSSAQRTLAPTGISPPQIEQRARRLAPVTLAGSTRKMDWHSGQAMFMTRQSH